jgi:hypothetical protein
VFDNGRDADGGSTANLSDSNMPHLYKTWKPILDATGHNHLLDTPELKGSRIILIIIAHAQTGTDSTATHIYAIVDDDTNPTFVERCRTANIPVLTSEWLIACLIHQRMVEPTESSRYRYVAGMLITQPL